MDLSSVHLKNRRETVRPNAPSGVYDLTGNKGGIAVEIIERETLGDIEEVEGTTSFSNSSDLIRPTEEWEINAMTEGSQ